MKLAFIDEGKGPVLVFLHSYLLNKEIWKSQIDFFKKDFRCISIDLPGHGESNNFVVDGDSLSLNNIAEEVEKLLKELNVDNYICIGNSLGGMLIPYLYCLNKENIRAAIMINTYLGNENEIESIKSLFLSFLNVASLYNNVPEGLVDQIVPLFFPYITDKNKDFRNKFSNRLKKLKGKQLETLVKTGKAIFTRKENLLDIVKNMNIPICFINGERNILYSFDKIQNIYKSIPNAEVFKLKKTDQVLNIEDKKEINDFIKDFFIKKRFYNI